MMLQLPGAASPAWVPALAVAWVLQLPIALAMVPPLLPLTGPPLSFISQIACSVKNPGC